MVYKPFGEKGPVFSSKLAYKRVKRHYVRRAMQGGQSATDALYRFRGSFRGKQIKQQDSKGEPETRKETSSGLEKKQDFVRGRKRDFVDELLERKSKEKSKPLKIKRIPFKDRKNLGWLKD